MTTQPQNKSLMIGILAVVLIGAVSYYMLNAPDHRTAGEKIGDAVDELGDRTPAEKIGDAIKK